MRHVSKGLYKRHPAQFAWMKEPWTCPTCGHSLKVGGRGPHKLFCGERRIRAFWVQVDKNTGNGCWLWKGWKLNSGYGETTLRSRKITVHRLSYMLAYGPIPAGKLVMHSCDEPLCVRPDHLRLGTDADNSADKIRKGRAGTEGERNIHARLTEEQVREIRRLFVRTHKNKSNIPALARQYGITKGAVRDVVLGLTWKHIV